MTGMTGSHSRKNLILEQATLLFSNHGFDGTSVRTIARASGITEAAIYRHFESKTQLYEEVIRSKAGSLDIIRRLEGAPVAEGVEGLLSQVAHQILNLAADDPQLMRLMFQNSLEQGRFSSLLFKEVRLPFVQFLNEQLERLIAEGTVRDVDPFITSRCFVGMVMDCALSIGVWAKMMDSQIEATDVVCNNVPIFARGLMAENPS